MIAAAVGIAALVDIVTPSLPGGLLIGGLLYAFHDRLAGMVSRALASAGQGRGSLLARLGDMLLRQVHLEWGYWVIALGAALMILAGLLRLRERAEALQPREKA